jgi:hypothetical protein
VENLELAGLQEDCPFAVDAEGEKVILTAESAEEVLATPPYLPSSFSAPFIL